MSEPLQIAPGEIYRAVKPVRDPLYLRFIRSLPCVVCCARWFIEAAHTGPRGLGQKSCDLSCIPLCRKHHTLNADSFHKLGRVQFETRHRLDIAALILMFNSFYVTKIKREAA